MKQAEHPPVTAGANSAAEYSLAIIDQLARIDRTCSKEEMDELVYRLLSLIGEAMQSDRVFLFERLEGTAEAYCNTFEWCANGVAPQIDNLTEIVPADMPYWLKVFGRGETIVIPNIEDVKTLMPSEYELLKAQSIRSEIAVPVFYRGNLSGFFGLDNPQRAMTAGQLRLLAFVGGHLGSARENLRMLTLLEEKQKSLEQNLQAVKLEQQMLKVFCKDSTSVYRVDLMNDRAEIVKIEEHSNSAGDLLPHGQELFSYAEAVEHYYHKCVLKESAPDFLQFLDAENLMRELRTKDRVSRRYQSVPNAIGNIYFEARANRVQQTETSFQILLDFRSVDEIVREEREHQHALETALTESRMSYEVISAISKIYYTIYRIDLRTGYYEEVASERQMHRLTGHSGKASIHMSAASKQSIVPEYLPYVEPFFDLSTLAERLRHEDSVMLEYPVRDGNWHLARFIVQTRGENGEAEQVLFAMRLYSEEKRREKDLMSAADAARRANEAKSEFLSRMSHDIRTPMNVIMGFTNIALQHADDSDKMKECLEKIRVSGSNLQELIDDVPDISRIESGEFKIVSQPVKLPELFDFYCQAIAGMAEAKNIRFSGKLHDISHNVLLSDQIRLGQIYMNLLSNAVKYMPENGDVKLEVYEEKLAESGKVRLVSVVSDTGIGMTPEFMEQMYSAFSRAVDTRVNKVRGSGLGLAIVKKIVDLMDGAIGAESKVGKGTTFRVTLDLPAAADDAETEEHTETAKHIPIIALTANAYHEDIQKCLAAGMNAHLSKPINIDRAVRTIIECARTAKENG